MDFSILHETKYDYPEGVRESYSVVFLQPRTEPRQICSRYELETTPPSRIFRYNDRFGNEVQHFTIIPKHAALTVASRSHVITLDSEPPQPPGSATRAALRDDPAVEAFYEFTHESPTIAHGSQLRTLLAELGEPDDAIGDWFLRAGEFVNAGFTYDTQATSVFTDIDAAIRGRAGVCQDFAHILVGLCRLAGIPARYVSGYVFAGKGRAVIGAEASHAWCEAYLPPHGWVGYDPTNRRLIDEHFVKIAIGRDYGDVSPVRGVYKGPSDSAMRVNVAVEKIPAPPQAQQ